MTAAVRLGRIGQALAALFPAEVSVALCNLAAAEPAALWPEERKTLGAAVPRRVMEFAAGRQAARQALSALGVAPRALPVLPDRAPLWPEGIAGSISHAAGLAVAVVRRGAPLGVDVEEDQPLPPDLWPEIASAAERAALPAGETGLWLRRLFAAKEALFKAQAQGARAMFGFDAAHVTLAEAGFDAQFQQDAGAFRAGDVVRGRLALVEGLVLAGVTR
ncbi:4'-phosphopantetheinyl transferase family protein [Rhodobacter calidifons]|uniref:Enterobactin synthase component D n=1 Tax=Rhodobacter calidifons TaxID=2715277 RepID=A0ABX0G6Z9_9RHOB|nr:4'-phosphopantetheinyl transferase superfamily protein [Rhodobacter calidifons]NHB77063.1 4'-phosphopantetheinyl transferase superfamily protein [Rhodobacter calidifons]